MSTDNSNSNSDSDSDNGNNKNSLMASLMADGPEQDLFGNLDDGAPTAAVTNEIVPPPAVADAVSPPLSAGMHPVDSVTLVSGGAPPTPVEAPAPVSAPAPAPTSGPSLLAQSGLLGMGATDDTSGGDGGGGDGGGGLFDAVDQEEEAKAAAKAKKEAEEAERIRQEQQAAAEQQRQAEATRQQHAQQQQQQQQQQQMMHQSQQFPQQQQQPQPQPPYGYASQQQSYVPQQRQQQQQSAMMQSVNLNPPTNPQQQQLQAGMQSMTVNNNNPGGFYREHPPSIVGTGPPAPAPTNTYTHSNATGNQQGQYYYGTQQPQQQQQTNNAFAGMRNAVPTNPGMMSPQQQHSQMGAGIPGNMQIPSNLGQVRPIDLQQPQQPPPPPLYTEIRVTEPMLIQQSSFLLSSAPYWSYQIASTLAHNPNHQGGTWLVRRRFRHVVALEDRLRQACPGSILPPRPDKHAIRALEEASTQQSAEFALQRAKELQEYLKALANHPVAGQSQALRLFLGLQDDIGTAWPEVSGNALTKLGAMATGMSKTVSETSFTPKAAAPAHEWEDNAELLTLSSSEQLRMGAVSQAVPKLEGTVSLVREQGDAAGAVGMELSKITKQAEMAEDFKVCDILSNGLLRQGRRTKRLALELSAAMEPVLQHYKLVRYEKMALHDRRQALQKQGNIRRGADQRAVHLAQQQRHLQQAGQFGQLSQLEQSAIYTDSHANSMVSETEEIGRRLVSEIHRVAMDRRHQFCASMNTIAKSMKEASTERLAIWESTLEALQNLPGGMPSDDGMMGINNSLPPPQQQQISYQQQQHQQIPYQQQQPQTPGNGIPSQVDVSNPMAASNMTTQQPQQQYQQQQQQQPGTDSSTIYA